MDNYTYVPEDPLIGFWGNWAGDDAGLGMIWGFGLEFMEDGIGISHYWGTDIKESEEKTPFKWYRISENKIAIGLSKDDEIEYDEVEYRISDHVGGRGTEYFKIQPIDCESFWSAPEPLYKSKE